MTKTTNTVAELKQAIREGFDFGALSGASRPDVLREFYEVSDDISDEEIEAAFADMIRAEWHSELVAVCANSGVVMEVTPFDVVAGVTLEDTQRLSRAIQIASGESTDLAPLSYTEDERDADYTLYTMPGGDYTADDGEHCKTYGGYAGRYRNTAQRQAAA